MPSMLVPAVVLSEAAGLATVGLVVAWMAKYYDGFALDRSGKEFNLHPVFMVLGMLFFNANALMTFRILGNAFSRLVVKLVHFVFQLLAVSCASFGLSCVFHFHNASGFANLYTLHSWIGLAAFSFFCLQLVLGFTAFLVMAIFAPSSTATFRKVYLQLHVYGGVLIFILSAAAALLGTAEVISFHISDYSELPTQAILANMVGVLIAIFVALVAHILYNEKYKASPTNSTNQYQEHINSEKD